MEKNKAISGIYIIEKKYELIWLTNKVTKSSETLSYFTFRNLLFQSFNEDTIKKILEVLNCEEKLLIDFDKDTVKRIIVKDRPFIESMNKYFSVKAAQEWLDNLEDENDLYKNL